MPLLQNPTDPIWTVDGVILFSKFGIACEQRSDHKAYRPIPEDYPLYARTLAYEQLATAPFLGQAFLCIKRLPISDLDPFSLGRPDAFVVTHVLVQMDRRRPQENDPHIYTHQIYVQLQSVMGRGSSPVSLEKFQEHFAPVPSAVPLTSIIARSRTRVGRRNTITERMRYRTRGDPLLGFSDVTGEASRIVRVAIMDTFHSQGTNVRTTMDTGVPAPSSSDLVNYASAAGGISSGQVSSFRVPASGSTYIEPAPPPQYTTTDLASIEQRIATEFREHTETTRPTRRPRNSEVRPVRLFNPLTETPSDTLTRASMPAISWYEAILDTI